MTRCQYEFNLKNLYRLDETKRCGRKALPDSDYCIRHEKSERKDIIAFTEEIEK